MNTDKLNPLGLNLGWLNPLLIKMKGQQKQQCVLCLTRNRHGQAAICHACHAQLPLLGLPDHQNSLNSCLICAEILASSQDNMICGACISTPPIFDCCIAAAAYRWPVDSLLMKYKSNGGFAEGKLLSQLLLQRLQFHYQNKPLPECIIPVPLHWRRKAARGFNQSTETAKHLGRWLDIPVESTLVRRTKHTRNQKHLSKRLRQRNMSGAFALRSKTKQIKSANLPKKAVPKYVAIIDDVVTTGATCNELSKILMTAGVERIDIWCIARTEAENDTLGSYATH